MLPAPPRDRAMIRPGTLNATGGCRAVLRALVISGQLHFVLGDEDRVVGTRHRSRPVNGPATFITIKSPCGTGELDEDYRLRPEAKEIEKLYPGRK